MTRKKPSELSFETTMVQASVFIVVVKMGQGALM
jgi:hypothetical protein